MPRPQKNLSMFENQSMDPLDLGAAKNQHCAVVELG